MTDLEAFVRDEERVERFLRSVRNNPSAVSEQKLLALLADRDAKLTAVRGLVAEWERTPWVPRMRDTMGDVIRDLNRALKAVSHE